MHKALPGHNVCVTQHQSNTAQQHQHQRTTGPPATGTAPAAAPSAAISPNSVQHFVAFHSSAGRRPQ
eukprot:11310666-Prorocentrum_lima.AAC.1